MPTELTLTLRDRQRREREIIVDAPRFTIGSDPDNDLVLDDSRIAEWHAVIERFGSNPRLTDYGARGGTLLNGHTLAGSAPINDGDVISLSESYELLVRWGGRATQPTAVARQHQANRKMEEAPMPGRSRTRQQSSLGAATVAIAGVTLVLVCLGIYLALPPTQERDEQNKIFSTPPPASPTPTTQPTEAIRLEGALRDVMRCISDGAQASSFDQPVVDAVVQRARQFQQQPTEVGQALRAVAEQSTEIMQQVGDQQLVNRQLLLYVVLADLVVGNKKTDAVALARDLAPQLHTKLVYTNSEPAGALLAVAGIKMSEAEWRFFLARRRVANPMVNRTVWYYHQQQIIKSNAHQFVVDFLALGALAHAPRRFGIAANALDSRTLGCAP